MNPSNPSNDNSIPLLTEIIPAASPEPHAPAPSFAPLSDTSFNPAPDDASLHPQPDDASYNATINPPYSDPKPSFYPVQQNNQATTEQLEQIRQDVLEGVMQQVLRQVDDVLHQHLQDHLAVVLDNMADILKTRVRASMEQALAASVTLALEQEMARFENAKK